MHVVAKARTNPLIRLFAETIHLSPLPVGSCLSHSLTRPGLPEAGFIFLRIAVMDFLHGSM
jgi:hypothetical protein